MRLLDTDVMIDLLRQHAPTLAWFATLTGIIALPGYVLLELYQGCRNNSDARAVQKLAARFPVVWASEADCNAALASFPALKLAHNLGLIDALIAACAMGQGATLCTFNDKHFRAVPGLIIEVPYQKP